MMPTKALAVAACIGILVAITGRTFAIESSSGTPPAPGATSAAPATKATPPTPATATTPKPQPARFDPPPDTAIPDNEFGKQVRLGRAIFTDTKDHAGAFVGNDLRCSNCHLDAGRLRDSAPMWAAYVEYPQYRSKTKQVDTFAERLRGCFQYSMNGKAPPLGSEPLVALEVYAYWLATGAPVNTRLQGAGYPKLPKPTQAPDFARGRAVYTEHCALCHGADGEGQKSAGKQVFPPLWGPRSFNWGAGMHQVNNAAGFIKANMPLGMGGTLSDQQAWDVAFFMDAHERPQDPRYTGSVATTRKKFHDSSDSLYGIVVEGHLLGSDATKAGTVSR